MHGERRWFKATAHGVEPVLINRVTDDRVFVKQACGGFVRKKQSKRGCYYVESKTLAHQIHRTLAARAREVEDIGMLVDRAKEGQ